MLILLYVLTALTYGVLAAQAIWGKDPLPRQFSLSSIGLAAAVVLHGGLLYQTVFVEQDGFNTMQFGFALALSTMFWLGAVIFLVESWFFAIHSLAALVLPLAALAAVLPWLFPGVQLVANIHNPLFKLHFVIAFWAYGLFAIAAIHAVLMVLAEQRLHRPISARSQSLHQPHDITSKPTLLDRLPPLLTLERLLFRMLFSGFVLLTLTILSGIVFSEALFERAFRFDHKTVFALISWAIFGALLIGRHLYGWRGRVALRWTFCGFVALLLAYIGSRFVLEVILHRV